MLGLTQRWSSRLVVIGSLSRHFFKRQDLELWCEIHHHNGVAEAMAFDISGFSVSHSGQVSKATHWLGKSLLKRAAQSKVVNAGVLIASNGRVGQECTFGAVAVVALNRTISIGSCRYITAGSFVELGQVKRTQRLGGWPKQPIQGSIDNLDIVEIRLLVATPLQGHLET